jgi:hypothetical protein
MRRLTQRQHHNLPEAVDAIPKAPLPKHTHAAAGISTHAFFQRSPFSLSPEKSISVHEKENEFAQTTFGDSSTESRGPLRFSLLKCLIIGYNHSNHIFE